MSKISTDIAHPDLTRCALNGPTMGTRWSALFFADKAFEPVPVQEALQAAVDAVDAQMSTWNANSDLMHLNRAPVGQWTMVPPDLMRVLYMGLRIGRASGGVFDIALGDAVRAWGFGTQAACSGDIQRTMAARRLPAFEVLGLDGTRARKTAPISIDLNGIAKGYGADRLAEVLQDHGMTNALVGIDGEMRALGCRPDGAAWTIAVEFPDHDRRTPHSILALQDGAIATSGDYRHWVTVQGRRLSHTIDPHTGAPLIDSPASVTVVAPTCAEADAWATALMVAGPEAGQALAKRHALNALFLWRDNAKGLQTLAIGHLFTSEAVKTKPGAWN